MKIRKGDVVTVTVGRDRGKTGKVLEVLEKGRRVLVEKLNIAKRHQRPSQKQPQGGIVDKEAPIDISNVMLLSKRENKPVRVGYKFIEGQGGKRTKVRYARKYDEILD